MLRRLDTTVSGMRANEQLWLSMLRYQPLVRIVATMSTSSHLLNGSVRTTAKLLFPSLPRELMDRYKPGQMFQHQRALPKLPVPPLHQTLTKYITSVKVRVDT